MHLAPQHLVFDDLASEESLELVEATSEDVDLHLEALANRSEVLINGALACLDLGVFGLALFHLSDLGLEILMDTS